MEENNSSRVIMISINDILPNRFQPRIEFDEDEILGLSASIKKHGIINPILVRKISDKYEIIAGERRYKAAVLAGLEQVPVILKELSDKDSAEIALLENIQRKDMSSIEEAISIQKILDMGYLTQLQLAEQLGKSQSYIANKLRLLKLSDEVQEALLKNKISERHARSLLRLKSNEKQNEMLNKIIEQRLTVRKTDEEIDKMNNNMFNNNESSNNLNQNISPANQEIIPTSLDSIFGTSVVPPMDQPVTPEPINQSQSIDENSKFFSFGTPEPVENVVQQNVIGTSEGVNLANEVLFSTPNNNLEQGGVPLSTLSPEPVPQPEVIETPSVTPEIPTTPIMEVPPVQTIEPQQPVVPPVQPVIPEIPSTPIIETPTTQAPTPSFEFDASGNVISSSLEQSIPEVPSVTPEISTTPIMEVPPVQTIEPQQPVVPPVQPVIPEIPATPIIETSEVPSIAPEIPTTPIMEVPPIPSIPSQDNTFIPPEPVIENTMNEGNQQTIQPIIITDYNKQYDPIMPDKEPPAPTVDFRDIINMIRNCSTQIENSGYVIDTEEYDLEGMYQVVFKIEKK